MNHVGVPRISDPDPVGSGVFLDPDPVSNFSGSGFSPDGTKKNAERSLKVIYQKKT